MDIKRGNPNEKGSDVAKQFPDDLEGVANRKRDDLHHTNEDTTKSNDLRTVGLQHGIEVLNRRLNPTKALGSFQSNDADK